MRHISISNFLGLNNVSPPEELTVLTERFTTQYFLKKAENVDITNKLNPIRRRGYKSIYTGSAPHSLWSNEKDLCLFREGQHLKRLHSDLTTVSTLRSGITGDLATAYLSLNNCAYYSDGNITGIIEGNVDRTWGIEPPPVVVLSDVPGTLQQGTYQIVATYVRNDGQESGSSDIVTMINASENMGIRISVSASGDPMVTKINIYITRKNSELFYRAFSIENETQSIDYIDEIKLSAIDCKTLLLSQPPAGQILEYYNGRIYIGSFDVVWYTEPFRYELVKPCNNFIEFGEDLTLIGAVNDGIYFGTDNEIVFAQGDNPNKFAFKKVADYGAIFGTMKHIEKLGRDGNVFKEIIFASKKGICRGRDGGTFINVTDQSYRYDPSLIGTGFIRFTRGIKQYIAVLKGSDIENSENSYYE